MGGRVMKKAAGGAVKLAKEKVVSAPMPASKGGREMLPDNSKLGIKSNKNPGERHGVPVAPRTPMINPALAKGGLAKVGKVMGEYKSGNLHSGSKSGPVVKSRKQAVAIALSEAGKSKK